MGNQHERAKFSDLPSYGPRLGTWSARSRSGSVTLGPQAETEVDLHPDPFTYHDLNKVTNPIINEPRPPNNRRIGDPFTFRPNNKGFKHPNMAHTSEGLDPMILLRLEINWYLFTLHPKKTNTILISCLSYMNAFF